MEKKGTTNPAMVAEMRPGTVYIHSGLFMVNTLAATAN